MSMNVNQPFVKLLEPGKIGQMTVKNRMVTNFASEEGYDLVSQKESSYNVSEKGRVLAPICIPTISAKL